MKSLTSRWTTVVCLFAALAISLPANAAQHTPTGPQVLSNAVANEPIQFDVSRPLAEMAAKAPAPQGDRLTHTPLQPKLQRLTGAQQRLGAVSYTHLTLPTIYSV